MKKEGVSEKTDQLAAELMGDAFDILSEGPMTSVLLVLEDAQGKVASYSFQDDGIESLLDGAYKKIRSLQEQKGNKEDGIGKPLRYSLCFMGAVADEDGIFKDALLLEFGEVGYISYSAYSFVFNIGGKEQFAYSEPMPAGEVESLL